MGEINIFHPNAKDMGSALKVRTAYADTILQIFPQKASDDEIPEYDVECPVGFVANWLDLADMLMVFRGEAESLGDGCGKLGMSSDCTAEESRLMLRHIIDPVHCYSLEVCEKRDNGERRGTFCLLPAEALGLSMIIEGVLHHALIGGEQ